jgi:hypothetical protein
MTYLSVLAAAVILGGETCGGPGDTGGTTVFSVSVEPSSVTIARGATARLVATANNASGRAVRGAVVTWLSANNAIAIIDQSGLVTGVAVGSTRVVAESGGKIDSATVNVIATQTGAVVTTKYPEMYASSLRSPRTAADSRRD